MMMVMMNEGDDNDDDVDGIVFVSVSDKGHSKESPSHAQRETN